MSWLGRWLFKLSLPFIRRRLKRSLRVRVIIRRPDGRVLLVKTWLGRQRWQLPGGGVKRRETAHQAVLREVKEEVGLSLKPTDLTYRREFDHTDPTNRLSWRGQLFELTLADPTAVRLVRPEMIEFGWFDPADLPAGIDVQTREFLSTD